MTGSATILGLSTTLPSSPSAKSPNLASTTKSPTALSAGAKAGVGVGAGLLAVILIAAFASLAWCLLRRHKARASESSFRVLDEGAVGEQELQQVFMGHKMELPGEDARKIEGELGAKEARKTRVMIGPSELDTNVTVGEMQGSIHS